MRLAIFGLSVTSSWGNGHATFWRALCRALARRGSRVAFFDDRAWFAARWGGRGPDGRPAYRAVTLGRLRVENRSGDTPDNAVLADGHAGLAWNALWAQSLVVLLNARFHLGIAPIRNEEIAALLPPAYR